MVRGAHAHAVSPPRPFRILHVEDDDLDAMNLQRALRGSPAVAGITRARDGLEALATLRSGTVRLDRLILVIDLQMPRMSGIELLEALRADPQLRALPVVVMSTSDDDVDLANAWEHNVAGYVIKSGDGERFRAALAAFADYWSRVEMP
jgi:CheY-like chemotaxis protein